MGTAWQSAAQHACRAAPHIHAELGAGVAKVAHAGGSGAAVGLQVGQGLVVAAGGGGTVCGTAAFPLAVALQVGVVEVAAGGEREGQAQVKVEKGEGQAHD
jgi:hypothetical protein